MEESKKSHELKDEKMNEWNPMPFLVGQKENDDTISENMDVYDSSLEELSEYLSVEKNTNKKDLSCSQKKRDPFGSDILTNSDYILNHLDVSPGFTISSTSRLDSHKKSSLLSPHNSQMHK